MSDIRARIHFAEQIVKIVEIERGNSEKRMRN